MQFPDPENYRKKKKILIKYKNIAPNSELGKEFNN